MGKPVAHMARPRRLALLVPRRWGGGLCGLERLQERLRQDPYAVFMELPDFSFV